MLEKKNVHKRYHRTEKDLVKKIGPNDFAKKIISFSDPAFDLLIENLIC